MKKFLLVGTSPTFKRATLGFLFLLTVAVVQAQRTASVSGNWNNTATWGGASVPTAADAVTINSGVTVTVNVPANAKSLTVNGTLNVNSSSNNLTIANGGFVTANSGGSIVFNSTAVINGGGPNASGIAITINSGASLTTANPAGFETSSGNNVTLNGSINVNKGKVATPIYSTGANYTYNGTVDQVTGNALTGANNLTLIGSGNKTLPNTAFIVLGNFITGGTANAIANADITIAGNVIINSGSTFTAGTFTHKVAGNWTNNGTFSEGTSTVVFNGTAPQSVSSSTFNNVEFSANNSGTPVTVTATGALNVKGYLKITGVGAFAAGSYTHMVGGDWIDNNSTSGGFNAGTSTINFNGTGTQTISELTNNFYNLTTSNTGTRVANTDLKVANNLSVSGGTFDLVKQLVNNTSSSGTLSVADGAILKVGGLFPTNFGSYTFTNNSTINYNASAPIVQGIAAVNYGNLTLSGGGVKNLPFTGTNPPVNVNGAFLVTGAGTTVNTNSDINFNGSFTLDVGTTFNNQNYIYVKGNWVNNGTFNQANRRVYFNGTTAQTIGGTTATTFYDLIIDNNAGVTFATSGTVDNTLTLTNGILSIQPANTLTLNNGALTIAGSPFSATKYIATLVDRTSGAKGVLQVNGAKGAYTFPVGDGTYYLPAIVTPVDLNSTANYTITAFNGITKNGQPNGDPLENKSTVVDAIWDINRTSGSGDVTVKLGWPEILEGAGFATQDDPEQGIAVYTGTWNAFDGVPDGDLLTATRTTVTAFGPFVVGIVGGQIILPVTFANVKAVETTNGNLISWSNMTEEDVVNYQIERSSNGRSFTTIATLTPTRNNNGQADYSSLDNAPLNGTNFYRIKVTEGTGKVTYSIVMMLNSKASATAFNVVPNPVISSDATLQITNLPAGKYVVNVYGTSGQLISSQGIVHAGGSASQSLNMTNVKPGYYLVELKGIGVQFTQHVIKQ